MLRQFWPFHKKPAHLISGQRAERAALRYLRRQQLKLVAKNYSCKMGEIDLIMTHEIILVFVEVRKRSYQNFLSGIESIDQSKRQRLCLTAHHFLQNNPAYRTLDYRFDAITLNKNNQIEWIQNIITEGY